MNNSTPLQRRMKSYLLRALVDTIYQKYLQKIHLWRTCIEKDFPLKAVLSYQLSYPMLFFFTLQCVYAYLKFISLTFSNCQLENVTPTDIIFFRKVTKK
jgi:hypothetical protein